MTNNMTMICHPRAQIITTPRVVSAGGHASNKKKKHKNNANASTKQNKTIDKIRNQIVVIKQMTCL
jgi:hypothetical protein